MSDLSATALHKFFSLQRTRNIFVTYPAHLLLSDLNKLLKTLWRDVVKRSIVWLVYHLPKRLP